ncbi:hypothetical protein ACFX13_024456 [Malus domestica]
MKKRDENDQLEMLEGAKSIGAGAATIASAGAAIGIGNVFSSYSLGLGARPKFADIQNGYQAAAFLFSDPQFLVFFFFTLALLLLYFWGTVQQREAARESILSKNTELGAAHKFSYGWAGVSLEPVFGSCTCNETPIKKRGKVAQNQNRSSSIG